MARPDRRRARALDRLVLARARRRAAELRHRSDRRSRRPRAASAFGSGQGLGLRGGIREPRARARRLGPDRLVAFRAERRAILSADANGSWPAELRFLLERHPRATWPNAGSASVAFWLQVHDRLRRDAAGLDAATEDYRSGRSSPVELAVVAAPRLRGLVAAMHGHHQIEDFEYFPEFRRAEPRLAAGFDRLERAPTGLSPAVGP